MKYNEINAMFTAKIAEMIGKGYSINTASMNGSQGEIAHVDFRKEKEVIRVVLHHERAHHYFADQIVLTVGRCNDENVIAAKGYESWITIWNNRLEIIEERVFWKMENHRNTDWYIEGDEGEEAFKKNYERIRISWHGKEYHERREFPGMEKGMLPAIRRHVGSNRYPLANVRRVYKYWSEDNNRYVYCADTTNKGTIRFN